MQIFRTFSAQKFFLIGIFLVVGGFPAVASASATNVYYSVGQSSSDLKTGSPTISISGNTATFSVAQTGNIGVGDAVLFGGTTVYISGKLNLGQTQWSVVTATGTTPVATSSITVTSIKHAFTSLNSALNSANGASFLNTTDLVANNYILNIACYYDNGPDTTSARAPSTWTTGANNYINIYTPTSTVTQANANQRHGGSWSLTAYQLATNGAASALDIRTNYVRVTGLQISIIFNASSGRGVALNSLTGTGGYLLFDSNIVRDLSSSGSSHHGIDGTTGGASTQPTFVVVNNIVYGFSNDGIKSNGETAYIYNNTSYNSLFPILAQATAGFTTTVYYKNNIAHHASGGTDYVTVTGGTLTVDSSSTNNLSSDTTAPGSNAVKSSTPIFVSTASSTAPDLHVSITDTVARDKGTDLSADTNFAFAYDIDGQSRPYNSVWDIGADESQPTAGTPPYITSFAMPSTSSSRLVTVSSFVATSSTGANIAAYMVDESSTPPTASDAGWSTASTSAYIFAGTGTRTAYAWVMDALGNISQASTTSVTITPAFTTPTSPLSNTFFGLQTAYLGSWPSIPFGSVRLYEDAPQMSWADIETSRGQYNWGPLDSWLAAAGASGQDVVYNLAFTPTWASGNPTQNCHDAFNGTGLGCNAAPSDVGSGDNYWKEFVTALVNHSLASPTAHIKYYELWNEADTSTFYTGTTAQLVTLAQDAYTIIHALDPTAVVLGPALAESGSNLDTTWLSSYYALGGQNYQDAVSIHPYIQSSDPSTLSTLLAPLLTVMNTYNISNQPIWATEDGPGTTALTDFQMKAYLGTFYTLAWSQNIARSYWFAYDGGGFQGSFAPLWDTSGVRPAGIAYTQLYGWLTGSSKPNGSTSNPCYQTFDYTQHCLLTLSNGNPAEIVWNRNATTTITVNSSFTKYETLDDSLLHNISGSTIDVGIEPVLLIVPDISTAPTTANAAPQVTGFTMPSSVTIAATTSAIPVSVFTALGTYLPVAGYLINESATTPSPSDSGWTVNAPRTYTISGTGTHKLYAWVKDTAGTISSSRSQTIVVTVASPKNVYYSVGQSSADLKTGSPTMTISNGVATFSVPQTGNIGVGDKITYGSSVVYITGKVGSSDTVWTVETATGDTPDNTAIINVSSITRAYTSLNGAINGAMDSSHLGTSNLSAANVILNFPCYFDTGPDTTGVQIPTTYLTTNNNYINIFTPNNLATQVNFSQRHNGIATSTGAFQVLSPSQYAIQILDPNVHITGLEITSNFNSASARAIQLDNLIGNNGYMVLTDNIIRDISSSGASHHGINTAGTLTNGTFVFANNILDNFSTGDGIKVQGGTFYLYNNTSYGNNFAYVAQATSGYTTNVTYKNNAGQNSAGGSSFVTVTGGTLNVSGSSSNNLSDHNDAPGSGAVNGSASFVNTASSTAPDLHLLSSDTKALDKGTNLSADAIFPFVDDINGYVRGFNNTSWDIGAAEYLAATSSSISVTSPAPGDTVSGSHTLTVSTTDTSPISYVQYAIDGSLVGTSLSSPFSLALNFNTLSAGAHSLYAILGDTFGVSTSSTVSFNTPSTSGGGGGGGGSSGGGGGIVSGPFSVGFSTAGTTSTSNSFTGTTAPSTNNTGTASGGAGYTFTQFLQFGDDGAEVTHLQRTLLGLGFFSGTPNGHFGPLTMAAVKAFQKANNLDQKGYVGPGTRAALNFSQNNSTSTTSSTPSTTSASSTNSYVFQNFIAMGMSGEDVMQLQTKLAQLGFFSGTVTGYFGPLTQAAVKAFQAAHNLDQLGYVGPGTRAALNAQ
jgi:peptidoglycan hydrolase-like protein with peptidoglycan-binding domain